MATIKVTADKLQPNDIIFTGEVVARTWKDKLTEHGKIEVLFIKQDGSHRQTSYPVKRYIAIERSGEATWHLTNRDGIMRPPILHTESMSARHMLLYGPTEDDPPHEAED